MDHQADAIKYFNESQWKHIECNFDLDELELRNSLDMVLKGDENG